MPRYFFHVRDSLGLMDEEGLELADLQAAQAEAIRTSGQIIHDMADVYDGEEWRMEVTDATGATVITLRFMAAQVPRQSG